MNKSDKIKIAIVDDHPLVRDALAVMLQQVEDMNCSPSERVQRTSK